jgi:hypothetical protein
VPLSEVGAATAGAIAESADARASCQAA